MLICKYIILFLTLLTLEIEIIETILYCTFFFSGCSKVLYIYT